MGRGTCSICQLPWYKYSHRGQTCNITKYTAPASPEEPAPAHHPTYSLLENYAQRYAQLLLEAVPSQWGADASHPTPPSPSPAGLGSLCPSGSSRETQLKESTGPASCWRQRMHCECSRAPLVHAQLCVCPCLGAAPEVELQHAPVSGDFFKCDV